MVSERAAKNKFTVSKRRKIIDLDSNSKNDYGRPKTLIGRKLQVHNSHVWRYKIKVENQEKQTETDVHFRPRNYDLKMIY